MIVEIILKKLKGPISEEEEILFEKWLSEDDENFLTFQRLKKLQDNKLKELQNIHHLDSQEAWGTIQHGLHTNKSNKRLTTSYFSVTCHSASRCFALRCASLVREELC